MIRIERLADVFVDVADTLVTDFDVIDFLHTVAAHAAEITGTSAAGLMLSDADGRLHYMGASNEEVGLLELFQVQNDEGPCLDCYRTGEAVIEVDLAQDPSRWPAFAPRALAAGIRSVHAFPMRVRDRVIGALNVFGADRGRAVLRRGARGPGPGGRGDHRDPAGACPPPGRDPHRAAELRAQQPHRHRAGQGRGRPHLRHLRRRGVRADPGPRPLRPHPPHRPGVPGRGLARGPRASCAGTPDVSSEHRRRQDEVGDQLAEQATHPGIEVGDDPSHRLVVLALRVVDRPVDVPRRRARTDTPRRTRA